MVTILDLGRTGMGDGGGGPRWHLSKLFWINT